MTSEQLAPLNRWVKKRLSVALNAWLYLNNFCRRVKLKVFKVTFNDVFVLRKNTIDIFWSVKGCHKIEVGHFGAISGNVKGVTIPYDKSFPSIELVFYGVKARIKRKINLPESYFFEKTRTFKTTIDPAFKRSLCLDQNLVSLKISDLITIQKTAFQRRELTNLLPQPILMKERLPVFHRLPNVKISLPEYRQEDYSRL
ncbi:hypothetical protein [Nibribacter koreensis]|uniref:Uncharacterized protein n=1 Tax=Nibribacter koreensis TaxID=1084519 RepID=A0ABP8FDF8_9BACT